MSQRKYGAILSYVSVFLNILLGLVITPVLVRSLGQAEYGLYILIGSLAGYLAIMDLGLSDSTVRYVAKYRATNDRKGEENFLAIISAIYFCIGLLVLLAGWSIYLHLPSIFDRSLNPEEMASARIMYLVLLANVVATILLNPVNATIQAYERFVVFRSLEVFTRVTVAVGTIAVLVAGYKAVAVVIVTSGINLLVLLFKVTYAFVRLKVRLKCHHFDWYYVKDVFRYSMAIFVVVIVEQIYWKIDNLILGIMLNPSVVAVYAIGMSFHKYFMSFGTAISKVVVPKIVASVETGKSDAELTDYLITVSRIQALVLMLVLSGLVLYGREFIGLWVGPEYGLAYYVMLVTLVPYAFEMTGNVRNVFLQAKNLYWYRAVAVLVLSLANILLTIVLVKTWGMLGAAVSTGLGIALGYIVVNLLMKWKAGLEMERYPRGVAAGIFPALLLSGLCGALLNLFPETSWMIFFGRVITFTMIYLFFMWFVGMNAHEKQLIRGLLPVKRSFGSEAIG